jgi:hypothetical protein
MMPGCATCRPQPVEQHQSSHACQKDEPGIDPGTKDRPVPPIDQPREEDRGDDRTEQRRDHGKPPDRVQRITARVDDIDDRHQRDVEQVGAEDVETAISYCRCLTAENTVLTSGSDVEMATSTAPTKLAPSPVCSAMDAPFLATTKPTDPRRRVYRAKVPYPSRSFLTQFRPRAFDGGTRAA